MPANRARLLPFRRVVTGLALQPESTSVLVFVAGVAVTTNAALRYVAGVAQDRFVLASQREACLPMVKAALLTSAVGKCPACGCVACAAVQPL